MKIRLLIISSLLSIYGVLGFATPAHAGLWCENVDRVDESAETGGAAGSACRAAIGLVCEVVTKDAGCLQ